MRVLRSAEDAGGEILMGKSSLASARNLWNEWEIHCLILGSLGLQVFLFFTAGMRRRSSSRVLSTVLWLAYLSADSVAIFVLGHLAARGATGPEHELILFWAPFLLVHLGGQDSITAFSVQDNELWTRHLLGFVSQVVVAGYVVSKSAWQDKRLLAATVIVFLAGSFKYAGRTWCLFLARPANIRVTSLNILSSTLSKLKLAATQTQVGGPQREHAFKLLGAKFDLMLGRKNNLSSSLHDADAVEIMSHDAPLNHVENFLVADDLPSMLEVFQNTPCLRRRPYEYVGGELVKCYEGFYTKKPISIFCEIAVVTIFTGGSSRYFRLSCFTLLCVFGLIATLFQYLSAPIALVLFILAEKGNQVHSRVDIIVSYVLLVGAIILEVSSASMSIVSYARYGGLFECSNRISNGILHIADYIQPACSRKLWSEKLVQYNMVKRYTVEDTTRCLPSLRQRIGRHLTDWGVKLLDRGNTDTQVTEDLKGFVLNNLLLFGKSKQYDFASFRGQLALQKWIQNNGGGPETAALYDSINGVKDFPTSVLIWHIATDICYDRGNSNMATSTDSENLTKKKQMSRELSNYIMYLVFKCGVMLTSSSQLVHNKAHDEIQIVLTDGQESRTANLGEKEAVKKVFEGTKDEQPSSSVIEEQEGPVQGTDIHLKELLKSTAEAIYSPVLPRACKVARELMGIHGDAERWDLIAAVWSEMLFYSAPRCGGAFHYQHLATGGEFITHVLLLMRSLGPFLPGPTGSAP